MKFDIKLDRKSLEVFDEKLSEYMKFSKRAPSETINTKMYFIARNAVNHTVAVPAGKITQELTSPSQTYPDVPLAGIIINSNLGKKGLKGLSGPQMAKEILSLTSKRERSRNMARAGWIPAIKKLDGLIKSKDIKFSRKGKPSLPSGVKANPDRHLGNAKPARQEAKTAGEIVNTIKEFKDSPKLDPILEQGLLKAVAQEAASMQDYLERKYQEQTDKFNK